MAQWKIGLAPKNEVEERCENTGVPYPRCGGELWSGVVRNKRTGKFKRSWAACPNCMPTLRGLGALTPSVSTTQ
jgi:hypothetical protein